MAQDPIGEAMLANRDPGYYPGQVKDKLKQLGKENAPFREVLPVIVEVLSLYVQRRGPVISGHPDVSSLATYGSA